MLEDKFHDQCGVFGIYDASGKVDVARIAYYALYGLQHRGQESAGIAVSNGKRFKLRRGMGLVRDVFKTERQMQSLGKGRIAVGHNRYSTTGSSHLRNAQPFCLAKNREQMVIAHNGNLINTKELKRKVKSVKLNSTTDTELIAALLLESKKKKWQDKFLEVLPQLVGAYSLVVGTKDLLFGVRDRFGVRPLILGKLNKGWVLASEDCIFPGIGAKFIREVKPGEVVAIGKRGVKTLINHRLKDGAFCIFEYVYLARPDSTLNSQSVGNVRARSGEILAVESPVKADMVMAIPDSGTTAAIAFAKKSGIPFGEGVIHNRYIGRTFIQPDQRMRELGVKIKFGPMAANLKGKRVVVVDDSIVRGTTMREFIQMLRNYGAREVHIRIASPPIIDPCFYGVDTPQKESLIASHFENGENVNVEKITEFIGANSLAYLSLKGLLKAAGAANDSRFCTACFSGKYKIPLNGELGKYQLEKH